MLQISKLTDYATVIMSFLALDPQKVFSATVIAKELHLALPTVSKILKILAGAKLVTSFRGTGGGYHLSRLASEITMAEVVSAIEGPIAMTECCATDHTCTIHSLCTIKDNWKVINNIILTTLGQITLQDMTSGVATKSYPPVLRGIPIKIEDTKHV